MKRHKCSGLRKTIFVLLITYICWERVSWANESEHSLRHCIGRCLSIYFACHSIRFAFVRALSLSPSIHLPINWHLTVNNFIVEWLRFALALLSNQLLNILTSNTQTHTHIKMYSIRITYWNVFYTNKQRQRKCIGIFVLHFFFSKFLLFSSSVNDK